MRSLVVDDSRTVRTILRRFLERLGFEVDEAENGRVALDRLAGLPADLVFVDWDMPEMDGIEFVRAVRGREQAPRLVMVTKDARLSSVQQALDAGADEYIMKPFTFDIVREKLALLEMVT